MQSMSAEILPAFRLEYDQIPIIAYTKIGIDDYYTNTPQFSSS